jgi:hypothetical protein
MKCKAVTFDGAGSEDEEIHVDHNGTLVDKVEGRAAERNKKTCVAFSNILQNTTKRV